MELYGEAYAKDGSIISDEEISKIVINLDEYYAIMEKIISRIHEELQNFATNAG